VRRRPGAGSRLDHRDVLVRPEGGGDGRRIAEPLRAEQAQPGLGAVEDGPAEAVVPPRPVLDSREVGVILPHAQRQLAAVAVARAGDLVRAQAERREAVAFEPQHPQRRRGREAGCAPPLHLRARDDGDPLPPDQRLQDRDSERPAEIADAEFTGRGIEAVLPVPSKPECVVFAGMDPPENRMERKLHHGRVRRQVDRHQAAPCSP
jgi:hypothetical protein